MNPAYYLIKAAIEWPDIIPDHIDIHSPHLDDVLKDVKKNPATAFAKPYKLNWNRVGLAGAGVAGLGSAGYLLYKYLSKRNKKKQEENTGR